MGDAQVVARMVKITAARCVTCGRVPSTQQTPHGVEPFGTPVPARWLELQMRLGGSTHGPIACGPVLFEMEPCP